MQQPGAMNRRKFLLNAGLATVGLVTLPELIAACGSGTPGGGSSKGTLNFADIGVGDPGNWSQFTSSTGWGVHVISMGNAPAQILNVLISGGGLVTYDIANTVGGYQQPLVSKNLIKPIDTSRIPNWAGDTFITQFLGTGTPGFGFISYQDKIYGVPSVMQGDSFAYFADKTGVLDSYGALFDPHFKGYSALEDNYTTSGQKTALYLKASGRADIKDPANMTPPEIKTVVDFLIAKKKAGQFRTIWSSFQDAVDLMTRQDVLVIDCWEPMVFTVQPKGLNWVYAKPKEGFLLWAMAAYIVNNTKRASDEAGIYDLFNFMLGGWYGAKITLLRGYMTNPQAPVYAKAHPDVFSAAEAEKIATITTNVQSKFTQGGTWQNRWPTYVDVYESEWARFKAA
jgi:putative spermidine/putrescine transport system substrate-binding protein